MNLMSVFRYLVLVLPLLFSLNGWTNDILGDIECAYVGDVFPDLIGEKVAVLPSSERSYISVGNLNFKTVWYESTRAMGEPWAYHAGMDILFLALAKPEEGDRAVQICEGEQKNPELAKFIAERREILKIFMDFPGGTFQLNGDKELTYKK